MRNKRLAPNPSSLSPEKADQAERAKPSAAASGLREFRLGRAETAPQFSKRSSSLHHAEGTTEEALLRELVQAKTAEAVARQEADEWRGKLEALRRAYGLGPEKEAPGIVVSAAGAGAAAMGLLGRLTGDMTNTNATSTTSTNGGGGFWGWRR